MKNFVFSLCLGASLAFATQAISQEAEEDSQTPPCRVTETSRALDFWLGVWDVYTNDEERNQVGTNRIELALAGCAVYEQWKGNEGGQGKSLFFFDATENTWTQIWVTGDTSKPWGLKEKRLVNVFENGAVRFQSWQDLPNGRGYMDRTTLIPMEGGNVRQLIEISRNGGDTWQTTFDAVYVPSE